MKGIKQKMVAAFAVSILAALKVSNGIVNPIKSLVELINKIGSGDFTVKVDKKLISRNDEIGAISKSINQLKDSISDMIKEVKESGDSISNNSNNLIEGFNEFITSTENINCAISEIAEGNTKQSQDITDISVQTDEITMKVNALSDYINIVKNNTIKIEDNTEASKKIVSNLENSVLKFDKEFISFQ